MRSQRLFKNEMISWIFDDTLNQNVHNCFSNFTILRKAMFDLFMQELSFVEFIFYL